MPLLDPHCLVAEALDLVVVMRDDEHGDPVLLDERLDPSLALLLEHEVAHRQNLVDDEDVGHDDGGDCKSDARHHAR